MKPVVLTLIGLIGLIFTNCSQSSEVTQTKTTNQQVSSYPVNLTHYPSMVIKNDHVQMKIYLPDSEKGLYRATRFDWSGVIGSVQYRGHEYFGYWKDTHDPLIHEDLTGPVEGFIAPGLGYAEAAPGDGFIRIGVGVIEKEDEPEYRWADTYNILDYGKWNIESGEDWVSFTHQIASDFGYAYVYSKTVKLKNDGFVIRHNLRNTGSKTIETDQFNHNFFMIDGETSGPSFTISFPYSISTEDDLKDMMKIESNNLYFNQEFIETSLFMTLTGYSQEIEDHQVTVVNNASGAGVTFSVDQPLYRMCFWACETTLSPENFIWITVAPGEEMEWNSEYSLFEQ